MPSSFLPSFFRRLDLRIHAVFISCLLSFYSFNVNPLLNPDAFGYLKAAELYSSHGALYVLSHYGWYHYSILIALLNQLFPIGLLNCAHLLNMFFYGVLVYGFISLVCSYRDTTSAKAFAALCILAFPLINEMRYLLIRDFAFWAFSIAALVQLIKYHRSPRLIHGLGWCLSLILATLFRLEALILLVLTPIFLLCDTKMKIRERYKTYLKLQLVLLAVLAIIILLALVTRVELLELMKYAYRYYLPGIFNLGELLADNARQMNQLLFDNPNFPGNLGGGLLILLFAYLYTLCANIVMALSIPLSSLLAYGFMRRKIRLENHAYWPLLGFISATVITLIVFIFIMHFMTQRYVGLLSLLLLSLIPLCLETIHRQAQAAGKAASFWLLLGFSVVYFSIDSLISFGHSKQYIEDAISWTNNQLAQDELIYTNNHALAYFSGRVEEYDRLESDLSDLLTTLPKTPYLILDLDHDDEALKKAFASHRDLNLIIEFSNNRNDSIRVYRQQP